MGTTVNMPFYWSNLLARRKNESIGYPAIKANSINCKHVRASSVEILIKRAALTPSENHILTCFILMTPNSLSLLCSNGDVM